MLDAAIPFDLLGPGLGVGRPAPAGWHPLPECELLVLVGVTGVGKSTILAHLGQAMNFTLLPDRRDLTDRLIIATMQAADGVPVAPVADRSLRFAYTRRYRTLYPGGMAHALAQLWVDPALAAPQLVFDGLRGANEVAYAASALPMARFVMLDAPDWVRVRRLLNRQDAFDQVAVAGPAGAGDAADGTPADFAALGVPDAAAIFAPAEEQTMLAWVRRLEVDVADLRTKLQIVVEERRNYDPAATQAALQAQAPDRMLHLNTEARPPAEVADHLIRWLAGATDQP